MLEIEARCNLDLRPWYADNGIIIGRIEEVQKALEILRDFGPDFNIAINVSKTTAHWPSIDSPALQALRASVPINVAQDAGLMILATPVGSTELTQTTLAHEL